MTPGPGNRGLQNRARDGHEKRPYSNGTTRLGDLHGSEPHPGGDRIPHPIAPRGAIRSARCLTALLRSEECAVSPQEPLLGRAKLFSRQSPARWSSPSFAISSATEREAVGW